MDVQPAHLNRDSFRDSFKGLVALEIILDLPFGFPINHIISLHNTGFFPDCCLLSVTNGSIWIPYLARYSEIFKKPNFQVVKAWSKFTFIWKMLSQTELETKGSRLATIFSLSPTPLPHTLLSVCETTGYFCTLSEFQSSLLVKASPQKYVLWDAVYLGPGDSDRPGHIPIQFFFFWNLPHN